MWLRKSVFSQRLLDFIDPMGSIAWGLTSLESELYVIYLEN